MKQTWEQRATLLASKQNKKPEHSSKKCTRKQRSSTQRDKYRGSRSHFSPFNCCFVAWKMGLPGKFTLFDLINCIFKPVFGSSIVQYIQCHLARVGKIICSWWALLKPQACPAPPNKTNCQINLPLKPLLGLLPSSWNILHKREWKCKVSWELKVANVNSHWAL